jgi:hypothetical protein
MVTALLLDKLCQHSTARFRMDKRDAPTVRPDARRRIDQANARRRQIIQSYFEIRHGVRDMMHPLATLGQVTGDRTIRVSWSNELNPARSGAKRRNLNRLLGKQEPFASGKSKRSVTRQRFVEVGHDDCDVVQLGILEPGRRFVQTSH